jgi:hypothetical protein
MPRYVIGAVLVYSASLIAASVASAQAPPPVDLKARCSELLEFFDWYGADRSENSDGARNHTRIAAGIDCTNGRYAEGVAAMEALLRRKGFNPSGSLATPWKVK